MVFLFGMPRAGWNTLPRPARSALNQEVRQGSREWLCHSWDAGKRVQASSILLRRARKIKKNHPLGGFSFWNAAGRVELAASTSAHQRTDCCRISRRAACPQAAAVYRRCLRLPRGEPFRRGRRPRRPVSAAVPRWERIPTSLRAAKQVPLGDSSA